MSSPHEDQVHHETVEGDALRERNYHPRDRQDELDHDYGQGHEAGVEDDEAPQTHLSQGHPAYIPDPPVEEHELPQGHPAYIDDEGHVKDPDAS